MDDAIPPPRAPGVDEHRLLERTERDIARMMGPITAELEMGFRAVARIDRPAVSIFGSARTPTDDPWYRVAEATGAGFAAEGWAVVTGGGPGIMEAANRGAQQRGGLSVGFSISLPHEEGRNAFVDLAAPFEHFYVRKVMFVKAAEGFVVFPGGLGTMDELFEALTLIQTAEIRHFPVVLMGRDHWAPLLAWARDRLEAGGYLSSGDLDLASLTDDPQEAVHRIVDPYRDGDA
jgi:uncharacterized protein (TIGR00730 family)